MMHTDMRDPDWEDDAADMMQSDKVFIEWTALTADGEIVFQSDATISPRQAAAMFRAIGAAYVSDNA